MKQRVVFPHKKGVYRLNRIIDEDLPEYNCCTPIKHSGGCYIADCWICDEKGKKHPNFILPIPIHASNVGALIKV